MRLGVHVSIKNGFIGAGKSAIELDCDGFQMFVGNPRGWARKPIPEAEFAEFKAFRTGTKLGPVVVHLAYLPNPATEEGELYEKSVLTLAEDFRRANALGAEFFVFHPGKSKTSGGLERVAQTVNLVLSQVTGPTIMLFENQAGAGSELTARFEDMARLVGSINQRDRVGVCFDTCHAFAAGYDLASPTGWKAVEDEVEQTLGWDTVKLFHLNDSQGERGSKLDRHHHIGMGRIGLAGFEYLMNHPRLSQLPGILETPQEEPNDDRKNLATLRNLMRKG